MDQVLVVNAGSSSIKFAVFEAGPDRLPKRRLRGKIDGIGTRPRLVAQDSEAGAAIDESFEPKKVRTLPEALMVTRERVRDHLGGFTPSMAGHRVVHGGPRFDKPVVVDNAVMAELEKLVPLAPLHQPNNLAPIRALLDNVPDLPQVACFDTAFHRGHPEVADRYAIQEELHAEGVRRYGFHGLSYEYISSRLRDVAPEVAEGRIIIAHLGSGASMCAIVDGRSVESTMGFTALDGLPMGTRCGQIDPGVVLYLLAQKGMKPKDVEHLLYHECGLKGLSGLSSDVRDLLADCNNRGKLAIDFFVYRAVMLAGSLVAAMGGLDAFVFTAGIGENAPSIRAQIVQRLSWLGLDLDSDANDKGEQRISSPAARIPCFVIPTDEELMIAQHTVATLRQRGSP